MTTLSALNTILSTRSAGSEVLCANPYNGYELPFFYFSSAEEYEAKMDAAQKIDLIKTGCGDFEHELMHIDGAGSDALLDSCNSVEDYFNLIDQIDSFNDEEKAAFHALTTIHFYSVADALESLENVFIMEGNLQDYAYEQVESMGLEGFALQYFDVEKYARDLDAEGGILEFRFNHTNYVLINN